MIQTHTSHLGATALACALALGLATGCADGRRAAVANGAAGDSSGPGGRGDLADVPGNCEPEVQRCQGSYVQTCNAAGDLWEAGEDCNLTNRVCDSGSCVERPADEPQPRGPGPDEDPVQPADPQGQDSDPEVPDGPEEDDLGGGDDDPDGGGEGEGDDEPRLCDERARQCDGAMLLYCIGNEWRELEDCADTGRECEDGECLGCQAGALSCRGSQVVQCDDEGRREQTVEICAQGSRCVAGACVALCGDESGDKASYQGCEYWAVDLDNADVDVPDGVSPSDAQFAVVVSNVNAEDVEVIAWLSDDGQAEEEVLRTVVEGGGIEVLNLPPRAMNGSGVGYKAYRISSSQAVIAYQFNPLNNTDEAFSNDASLLIPSNALGDQYFAVTGDGFRSEGNFMNPQPTTWGSFVTVVGVGADPVEVTVQASTDIQDPGEGSQVAGRTVTATLGRYQVLSVHSLPEVSGMGVPPVPGNGNMSGTRVSSTGPVAVFSGNVAIVVPVQDNLCCADHLEEQLWPVDSWGKKYVAARSLVRRPGSPEEDFWRITGSVDGTELQYRPVRPNGAPTTIDRGQSVEFGASEHFVVEANQPIQVAQFLASSQWVDPGGQRLTGCQNPDTPAGDRQCLQELGYLATCQPTIPGLPFMGGSCSPISDPAMILAPPSEQYRSSYVFLTPNDYNTDFINVVAPAGAMVELDGAALPADAWEDAGDIDGTTWRVATVVVPDGRHVVESDVDFGLLVYGYDQDVSYGYPGGLDLEKFGAPAARD